MRGLKEADNNGSKTAVHHLPPEIIWEILSRLPVESIFRCKLVCKSWCRLILDPYFNEMQLIQANARPKHIILYEKYTLKSSIFLLDQRMDEWKDREFPVEFMRQYTDNEFIISGCCNGLLCILPLCSLETTYIYNPITKLCVSLPLPDLDSNSAIDDTLPPKIGFGVDSTTKKYKVLRVQYLGEDIIQDTYQFRSEIITLGESLWRELETPTNIGHGCWMEEMFFLDGSLYWISQIRPSSSRFSITVFDIGHEKFRTIKFPPSVPLPSFHKKLNLMEIDGSMALVECERTTIRLWRIVRDGVHSGDPEGSRGRRELSKGIVLPSSWEEIENLPCDVLETRLFSYVVKSHGSENTPVPLRDFDPHHDIEQVLGTGSSRAYVTSREKENVNAKGKSFHFG
ncbi:PREDICTED: putative F-box protein At2g02030 [Nelumbo nucifera]|uniref:F-box protein At2g02030 n=1 Tax=Nelumbo nucifera TaxID=4432 RepID=A0A1U8ATA4_NELNU|nr:PREDICTED: putative F-box protein At2g02030 [Nelumbo nucifera]